MAERIACHFLRTVLCAASAAGCTGCAAFHTQSQLGPPPTVQGVWTGVMRDVTVTDSDGRRCQAAAIEIDTGPRLPYDVHNDPLVAGRLALLVRESGAEKRLVSPTELPAAAGQAVRVAGVMVVTSAIAPPAGPGAGVKPVSLKEAYVADPELVIQQPKVDVLAAGNAR